jgi:hypothetical protein
MLDVFRYELKRGFRRKGYLLASFGVPLIGIALILVLRFASTMPAFSATQMVSQAVEQVNNFGIQSAGLVDETGRFAPLVTDDDPLTVFSGRDAAPLPWMPAKSKASTSSRRTTWTRAW